MLLTNCLNCNRWLKQNPWLLPSLSTIAVLGLQEILQNNAFCDATKLQNAGLQMVQSQLDQTVFSRIKGIVENGLGHLFLTSSSSHFLNQTDFQQSLFNENLNKIIVTKLSCFYPTITCLILCYIIF